ncbi:MAG: Tll0287-like domain-containing protein [Prochlorothrix sp.]
MAIVERWIHALRTRTVAFVAIMMAVAVTAISCSSTDTASGGGASGIAPELVADYIHTVLEADRTAYTRHVVNRATMLEGKEKPDGVVPVEATEAWQQGEGIPLPAQMFRLGSEIANEKGFFTYNLISPWYLNDSHAPKGAFEEAAVQTMIDTGEPVKDYQEIGGQQYFSAMYPDKAVAEACVTCHNTHPVHLERYPDKQFVMDEVMGGVVINIPLAGA